MPSSLQKGKREPCSDSSTEMRDRWPAVPANCLCRPELISLDGWTEPDTPEPPEREEEWDETALHRVFGGDVG